VREGAPRVHRPRSGGHPWHDEQRAGWAVFDLWRPGAEARRALGGRPSAEPGADAGPAARAADRLDPGAQVYLHAREERGQQLAATLDKMAHRELSQARKRKRDGQDNSETTGTRPEEGLLMIKREGRATCAPAWGNKGLERVTRIELALSAWEVVRLRLLRPLICKF
jgi:hypothetical protein